MMYFSTVSQLTAFELAGSRNRLRRCGNAADWLLRVVETDSQFEWWDVSAASLTAWTSGLDRSLNMHNHTHRHLLQLKFSDRTVSKPHRHIGQHPFRYHRRRKEEERKEGKRRNFTLTHTLACLWWCWPQRSWMMQLLFSFPPFSLLLLLEVCVCIESWKWRGRAFEDQCRWCDWCRVTWFHVNVRALREFTLDYAPHCARPMKY